MPEASNPVVSLDDAWQGLLAAALLGTEHHASETPRLPAALEDLLEQAGEPDAAADSAAALLRRAAALALYQQAGRLPARTSAPLAAPCPVDEQACGSLSLNQKLERLLEEPRLPLWTEVLQAMAQAGLRLQETLLPRLLDQGAQQPELGEALLPVLGARGRWLAAQHPHWEYAQWHTPEDIWQHGHRRARQGLLRQQRQVDPAGARHRLSEVWGQEDAETRYALLEALAANLSLDDEAFLEAALGDRGAGVRRLAADLLARLPGSNLVQRMLARVQPLVRLDPGRWPLRRARLEIDPPESCTPEMARDGVPPAPPKTWQGGEKAFWLRQLLQMIPPDWWCQRFEKTPGELLDLAEHSEWKEQLHESWVTATCRCRDMAWAQALHKRDPLRHSLMPYLPAELREAQIRDLFRSRKAVEAVTLLLHHAPPWSLEFSRLIFGHLQRDLLAHEVQPAFWDLSKSLLTLAYRLHPGTARLIEQTFNRPGSIHYGWEKIAEEFLYILTVRHQILEEIAHDRPDP